MNNPFLSLPFDKQAESSIISALLLPGCDLTADLMSVLSSEHFYIKTHQIVFKCVSDMFKELSHIDLVTVTSKLQDQGRIDDVGGVYGLSKLVMDNPLASHALEYAKIVKDKWRARQFIEKFALMSGRVQNNEGIDEVLPQAIETIFSLNESNQKNEEEFKNAYKELEDLTFSDQIMGLKTEIKTFDYVTGGLLLGKYYAIAGRVKQGKSAFASQIALNLIMRNVPGLYISLEMPTRDVLGRLSSTLAEIDYSKILRKTATDQEKKKFKEAYDVVFKKPITVKAPASMPAHQISNEIILAKNKSNIQFVVIDYIQKVRVENGDVRQSVSDASEAIRAACKEMNVAAIVVCQLNRDADRERPRLSHIKESGAIEQDADVVCLIYDTEAEHDGGIYRKKTLAFDANRNGPECEQQMIYEGRYLKFREAAKESFSNNREN